MSIVLRLAFLPWRGVTVGVKTRPSVEAQDRLPDKAKSPPMKASSGKSNTTWEDQSRFNLRRISLIGFPARSVGSSNVDALDLPYLLVLIIGTSQSR
ncbi:hypothetical protein Tco_1407071 [Tanacetum coccineum]